MENLLSKPSKVLLDGGGGELISIIALSKSLKKMLSTGGGKLVRILTTSSVNSEKDWITIKPIYFLLRENREDIREFSL